MAEVKLTPDQQKVVDASNCSLLVAAAAGSGKTAVLVKRIIEKITDKNNPADVSRMLIVTFTKAAAAEMKDRIRKAIDAELSANPSDVHLQQQAAAIINAQISTIDSFCMSVVKENFEELQLDPGFSVEEQAAGKLLCEDILEELFEEEYARTATLPEDPYRVLLRSFGSFKSDANVKKMVLDLYYAACNTPDPYEWLDDLPDKVSVAFSKSDFYKAMMAETGRVTDDAILMNRKAAELCNEIYGPQAYLTTLDSDLIILQHIKEVLPDYNKVCERINVKFPNLARKTGKEDPNLVEQVKGIRDAYKKTIVGIADNYFYCTLEKHDEMQEKTRPALLALIALTREFKERTDAAKRANNAYSFSDIAHMAVKILCEKKDGEVVPTERAREMRKNYDAIMIDEYQDSSYLQEYILRSISGEFDGDPNLFMVGDVKQSIYSFRNARPELFNSKYRSFSYDGAYRKIDLSMNFRSREAVLNAVNIIMRGIMRRDTCEIEYDKQAALYFGSTAYSEDTDDNDTEIILVTKGRPEKEKKKSEEAGEEAEKKPLDTEHDITLERSVQDDRYDEAIATGRRILELRKSGRSFGDIAVLVPKNKNVSDRFISAFNSLGIPVAAESTGGFFGAVEIEKVMSFLRILDNPFNDIPMAAVLLSEFCGFHPEDLARLKICYGKRTEDGHQKSLYDLVKEDAAAGNAGSADFLELLYRMSKEAQCRTVHEVIEKLYEVTGYKDAVTVLPGGDRRAANLDYLVTLAKKFENSSFAGLHDFLRYLDRLIERDDDLGEANGEAATDCVTLCTIHKSKGLEYPVVFMCCAGVEFNMSDANGSVLIDEGMGVVSVCVDTEKKVKQKAVERTVLSHIKRQAAVAEKARNLYVALTRAKEKLIVVGAVKDAEKTLADAANEAMVDGALSFSSLTHANCFFDMLLPVVMHGASDSWRDTLREQYSFVRPHSVDIEDAHFAATFRISEVVVAEDKAEKKADEEAPDEAEKDCGQKEEAVSDDACEAAEALLSDDELAAARAMRRDYVYPYLSEANAPMRVSVSELKHRAIDMLEEGGLLLDRENPGGSVYDKNRSRKEQDTSAKKGALRGTLYHEVLEKLQYTGDYSSSGSARESIEAEIARLIFEGFLPADIMETVKVDILTKFAMSSIGQEMIAAFKAGRLHREQAFVYGLTPEEYRRLAYTEEKSGMVMIQGIIDAYFETPDGLVIVDYKTDHINRDAETELTLKYRVQLELYGQALSDITGKKVVRRVLYSVSKDKVIEV